MQMHIVTYWILLVNIAQEHRRHIGLACVSVTPALLSRCYVDQQIGPDAQLLESATVV